MKVISDIFEIAWKIAGVLGLIGVTLAGLTAFAYWLFKKFAAGWLENRFKKELADHQHAHNREIERLRGEIASLLNRATKVHEKEFEALSVGWDLLTAMMSSAASVVSKMIFAENQVGGFTMDQLNEYLATMDVAETSKSLLRERSGDERQRLFDGLMKNAREKKAHLDRAHFHNHVITKGIFIQPDLRRKMMDLSNLVMEALTIHAHIWRPEHPVPRPHDENAVKITVQGVALMNEIDVEISARLWDVKPTVSA